MSDSGPSQAVSRNDLLKTLWKTRLPITSLGFVTPFVNQHGVYAASNVFLHRLDPRTGSILFSVSLPRPSLGSAPKDVQLIAPPESSMLIIGTCRHVLALDPISLVALWNTVLADGSDDAVSLLHHFHGTSGTDSGAGGGSSSLYAGSFGRVYRLKPTTGTIVARNSLRGGSYFEVRLRMGTATSTGAEEVLLVGTHGRVYALEPLKLKTIWRTQLPYPKIDDPRQPGQTKDEDGSPTGQITEVLCGSSVATTGASVAPCAEVVYAFWQGMGYRLKKHDGSLTQKIAMGQFMTSDVNLTVDRPNKRVYIIDRTQAERICVYHCQQGQIPKCFYRHRLPLPVRGDTLPGTVIPGYNGMVWCSEPGRIVLLDRNGNEVASHSFDATFQMREARLAPQVSADRMGPNTKDVVIVGISGYCVALEILHDAFRLGPHRAAEAQSSRALVEQSLEIERMRPPEYNGPGGMSSGTEDEEDEALPSYVESQEQHRNGRR